MRNQNRLLFPRRRFLRLAAGAAALPAVSRIAHAQAYPSRPVRIIVGFAPGGATDIMARLIGQWLSERFGQQFVIENRPGGATNIATEAVVKATPDGYTLLLATPANAINATLYEKLSFNFIRDVALVTGIHREPNVIVVHPSVPAKTVPELIAYAKANPGATRLPHCSHVTVPWVACVVFGIGLEGLSSRSPVLTISRASPPSKRCARRAPFESCTYADLRCAGSEAASAASRSRSMRHASSAACEIMRRPPTAIVAGA